MSQDTPGGTGPGKAATDTTPMGCAVMSDEDQRIPWWMVALILLVMLAGIGWIALILLITLVCGGPQQACCLGC